MEELVRLMQSSGFTPGAWGIWSGVLMFAAWWLREWRETRRLTADDREARRNGYAKQVELLTGENRALMEDQRKLREEYDTYRIACQAETGELMAAQRELRSEYDAHRTMAHKEAEQLRTDVLRLEHSLTGYERKYAELSNQVARLKGGDGGAT